MDIFNFVIENSSLSILAFFGFLAFYKGIPYLIRHNDIRHTNTERKIDILEKKIDAHVEQSKIDNEKLNDKLKDEMNKIEKELVSFKRHENNNSIYQASLLEGLLEEIKNKTNGK